MKIRVIGAGFYGCHIGLELLREGHDVTIYELQDDIFKGASGSIPARIHEGYHYPRSKKTRDACHTHAEEFAKHYEDFIHSVKTNIYAIAKDRSMVDFEQYVSTLERENKFEIIEEPSKYGLQNVEGALLTEERHIVTDEVREYFKKELKSVLRFNALPSAIDSPEYDVTVDATFCAYDNESIDRYEPCVVGAIEGDPTIAVTIMDGPFGSLYPWNPKRNLSSISSAKFSPFSKTCRTYAEAKAILSNLTKWDLQKQICGMSADLARYYPPLEKYIVRDVMLSIRAMPLSGADTRLVDVIKVGKTGIRIRAGKIDAVVSAARTIKEMIK